MIFLKLVNVFEGWIQESNTKVLDTLSQSNIVNNEVVISEISIKSIIKDDKNQEIYRFCCWSIKNCHIFTLRKRRLRNVNQLLRNTASAYFNI